MAFVMDVMSLFGVNVDIPKINKLQKVFFYLINLHKNLAILNISIL